MKKISIILLAAVAVMLPSGAEAKSYKRGVGENQFQLESQMRILTPGTTWYYNWGNVPNSGYKQQVSGFKGFEFVPMCWNANYNADNIRQYCRENPGTKYLLGFNEPNFTAQSNMTPAQAAEKWPAVQALAKELNLKLVAPAMNYSPNAPYQDPLKWFDEFVALVGRDAFDYVAIHNYGGLGVMKTLAGNFHDRYGKDVWVTEFCYWPNEGNQNSYVAPSAQISAMAETVEWLEKTPWIYRYAWFKPVGQHDSPSAPNYALIINKLGLEDRELSDQGLVYVYMSEFDQNHYNAVNELVAATEYISQRNVSLGRGANPECPKPIEVTQFISGATLDYQFDVPVAGNYTLELTVSGFGEPSRFDPNIAVVSVNADGTDGKELAPATKFTLPGSDTEYRVQKYNLALNAGRQTIRLSDRSPYQASGIHISTVRLSDNSGIEDVVVDRASDPNATVDVYTPSGVCVRRAVRRAEALDGLPAGIYIAGGEKYVIK